MRLRFVVAALWLSPLAALAEGKDFKEGLTDAEVARLTQSLGALEAKHSEVTRAVRRLERSAAIRRHAQPARASTALLKSHATVGAYLSAIKGGIENRDPEAHSFVLKLEGAIDRFELRLAALEQRAAELKAKAVIQIVAELGAIATSMDNLGRQFDAEYKAAVADVDLVLVPAFRVPHDG